jgi:hypothetical protein
VHPKPIISLPIISGIIEPRFSDIEYNKFPIIKHNADKANGTLKEFLWYLANIVFESNAPMGARVRMSPLIIGLYFNLSIKRKFVGMVIVTLNI